MAKRKQTNQDNKNQDRVCMICEMVERITIRIALVLILLTGVCEIVWHFINNAFA